MKKILLVSSLIFLSISIFAAPFGLKMGMTLEDITEVCSGTEPKHIEHDCYYISPTKKHPLFKRYIAFVDNEKGLYCLKAISNDIQTNKYGEELKNEFANIKERISKTYGKPRIIDKLEPDYLHKDEKYWLYAIEEGGRTYAAVWQSNSKTQLKDDLTYITIYVSSKSYMNTGWITLQYDFLNKRAVEDSQDDVF